VEFVVGSISAPGMCEGLEYNIAKDSPLRGRLFVPDGGREPRSACDKFFSNARSAGEPCAREVRRRSASARRTKRGSVTSFVVRGWRRARVCRGVCEDRGVGSGIRVHSAAAGAERESRWRAAGVPGCPSCEVVGAGDSAATGANEVRGNAAPSCVNLEQARLALG
jgi:hypothetical protein